MHRHFCSGRIISHLNKRLANIDFDAAHYTRIVIMQALNADHISPVDSSGTDYLQPLHQCVLLL